MQCNAVALDGVATTSFRSIHYVMWESSDTFSNFWPSF